MSSIKPSAALGAFLTATAVVTSPTAAQIDYRNLDEGRPLRTEDAYPVERHALELLAGYEYENELGDPRVHVVAPELSWGVLPNSMVGVKLPLAAVDVGPAADGTEAGFAGPRLFAFYNLNTESPNLPAFALRTDVALPWGTLAGDHTRLGITGILTRSFGRTRAHLNGTVGVGSDAGAAGVHGVPEWAASIAADRSFLRRSLLIGAELAAGQSTAAASTEVSLGLGARMQLTPTLVLDGGIERRLTNNAGPDVGLTLGLTHAFAVRGLMPGAR